MYRFLRIGSLSSLVGDFIIASLAYKIIKSRSEISRVAFLEGVRGGILRSKPGGFVTRLKPIMQMQRACASIAKGEKSYCGRMLLSQKHPPAPTRKPAGKIYRFLRLGNVSLLVG